MNFRCGLVGLFGSVGWLIFNKRGSVSSAPAGWFWVGNHGKVAQAPMGLAHAASVSGYPLSFCLFTLFFSFYHDKSPFNHHLTTICCRGIFFSMYLKHI